MDGYVTICDHKIMFLAFCTMDKRNEVTHSFLCREEGNDSDAE